MSAHAFVLSDIATARRELDRAVKALREAVEPGERCALALTLDALSRVVIARARLEDAIRLNEHIRAAVGESGVANEAV